MEAGCLIAGLLGFVLLTILVVPLWPRYHPLVPIAAWLIGAALIFLVQAWILRWYRRPAERHEKAEADSEDTSREHR